MRREAGRPSGCSEVEHTGGVNLRGPRPLPVQEYRLRSVRHGWASPQEGYPGSTLLIMVFVKF
jgi:hypothetical protein